MKAQSPVDYVKAVEKTIADNLDSFCKEFDLKIGLFKTFFLGHETSSFYYETPEGFGLSVWLKTEHLLNWVDKVNDEKQTKKFFESRWYDGLRALEGHWAPPEKDVTMLSAIARILLDIGGIKRTIKRASDNTLFLNISLNDMVKMSDTQLTSLMLWGVQYKDGELFVEVGERKC